ncbi:hypothetical protein ES705_30165 [subsurface metagenome]
MTIVNMYEAKANLSKLVQKALSGEEVILAKSGRPLVKLIPADMGKKDIKFGLMKGRIQLADNFNEFDPELQEMFKDYTKRF